MMKIFVLDVIGETVTLRATGMVSQVQSLDEVVCITHTQVFGKGMNQSLLSQQ